MFYVKMQLDYQRSPLYLITSLTDHYNNKLQDILLSCNHGNRNITHWLWLNFVNDC